MVDKTTQERWTGVKLEGHTLVRVLPPPKDRNTYTSLIDFALGQWRWYRRWRGGYWWQVWGEYSQCYRWWRHKELIPPTPPHPDEDYR